ncbi:MAG TPA: DUF167 domain-containing protein [Candidatus Binatia bacterium]|nr:DUF167 domain-containing protein [Candidatus Binatia bacterium]
MARRIFVTVRPNARLTQVTEAGEGEYRATVRAPAHAGQANAALVEVLARHFSIPKSRITILRGHASRRKLVELAE